MYKSQLQEYAQKAAILPPVYDFVKEGASHEPRFKAIVILNNVTYESPPGYPNLKSAEHAAAKAALDGLLQSSGGQGVTPSPVHESGLCKNLLQEYAQKNSLPLPVYQSKRSGEDHAPTFTSSVEIAGVKYSGGSAKNKKEAEIKAARTALLAIQSAQSSLVAAPEPYVTPTPQVQVQPQVGLATHINSHLNNNSGKKRGRGAALAVAEEPSAGRLKTTPHLPLSIPGITVKSMTPIHAAEVTQTTMNMIPTTSMNMIPTPKPEVQIPQIPTSAKVPLDIAFHAAESTQTSMNILPTPEQEVQMPQVIPPAKAPLDIADLFATPSAKKILGVLPKPAHTENPPLLQGLAMGSSVLAPTNLLGMSASTPEILIDTSASTPTNLLGTSVSIPTNSQSTPLMPTHLLGTSSATPLNLSGTSPISPVHFPGMSISTSPHSVGTSSLPPTNLPATTPTIPPNLGTSQPTLSNVLGTPPPVSLNLLDKLPITPTLTSSPISPSLLGTSTPNILGTPCTSPPTQPSLLGTSPTPTPTNMMDTSTPIPSNMLGASSRTLSNWPGTSLSTPTDLVVSSLPITTHIPSSQILILSSDAGIEGMRTDAKDGVSREVMPAQQISLEEVQISVVNGGSEVKEDQSFMAASQTSSLISLTG